eukprot:2668643-Pleurochrysis_carterae.AAC.1
MHTTAAGGTPARATLRIYVHAQLAVQGLAKLGLHAAPAKVIAGDPLTALGFISLGATTGRLRCPDSKRALLLASMADMRDEACDNAQVHWRKARSLVGRLVNISQVAPELKLPLRGGFAVARAAQGLGGRGGWRGGDEWLPLRKGGRARAEGLELLGAALALLDKNE